MGAGAEQAIQAAKFFLFIGAGCGWISLFLLGYAFIFKGR